MKKQLIIILTLLLIPIISLALGIGMSPISPTEFGQIRILKKYEFSYSIFNNNDYEVCYIAEQFQLKREGYKLVPEEWIILEPAETFCLQPHSVQRINGVLRVRPRYALERPIFGKYLTYVGGCTSAGNRVGACVAGWIKFQIGSNKLLELYESILLSLESNIRRVRRHTSRVLGN